MKPGYLTTEWWITLAVTLLAAIVAVLPEGSVEAKIVTAILAGAGLLGYNVSRGLAKSRQQ